MFSSALWYKHGKEIPNSTQVPSKKELFPQGRPNVHLQIQTQHLVLPTLLLTHIQQIITYWFSFVNCPALAHPHCRMGHKIGLQKNPFYEQVFLPKDDRDFMLWRPSVFH